MANADIGARCQRILQYFWDPEPQNDDLSCAPIWCLGRSYSPRPSHHLGAERQQVDVEQDDPGGNLRAETGRKWTKSDPAPTHQDGFPWPAPFLDDFEARFWFTYRNEFPTIPRSTDPRASVALTFTVRLRNIGETAGFTSDTGWGCMIRSGQCLLANAIALIRLGRAWRRGQTVEEEKKLVQLFADNPRAPFSVHKFVELGAVHCGKHPGEWFGPSATARCIEMLTEDYTQAGIKVYIAGDGAQIYEDSVLRLAKRETSFIPVLILVGIRLGINGITAVYREALQNVLRMKQSIGIAGGRPSASHYFVAVQGENFFYLDPHTTRTALPWHQDSEQYTSAEVESCHTRRLRRLHIDKMDPSMLLAFLIRSRSEWESWKTSVQELPGSPIVTIVKGEPPGDGASEREAAIEEVEAFTDEEDLVDDGDGELVEKP